jgi:butyryl-CoA dehydrogenase
MHTLDGGRIGIAAQALGIAEGALDRTVEYVKERKQFGRAIGQFQNTQFQLANMATQCEAAKLLVYQAADAKKNKDVYSVEAAKANDYEVIIIADHGNADNALNQDGSVNTAHSLNPVPFVYVQPTRTLR